MATPPLPQKQSGPSLESAVFYLSLALFAAVAAVFFYLRYAADNGNRELADISAQAAMTKTADQKILEDRILATRQRLWDFSGVLAERKISSEFFDEFEKSVLPGVYFIQCDLDMGQLVAKLSGHAADFEILSQQITAFGAAGALENVRLEKAEIDEKGGVDFEVSLQIKKESVAFR